MNTLRLIVCLITAVLLAGCASQAPRDSQGSQLDSEFDAQYMANVEYVAKMQKVLIYWVHPPKNPNLKDTQGSERD